MRRCLLSHSWWEKLPIANPADELRLLIEEKARRIVDIAAGQRRTRQDVLDWLKVEHETAEPGTKLQNSISLDSDSLIAEVKKLRGKKKPLDLAALRSLRDEHARTIVPAQGLASEVQGLEQRIKGGWAKSLDRLF